MEMKKKFGLWLAAGSLAWAGAVQAAGYGEAGCGLGAMLMGSGGNQVFAATTNASFYSQTLGILFGTSNCGSGGAAPSVQGYVETNRASLANDIARGRGETLDGLVNLLGCRDSLKAGAELQKDYPNIFPEGRQSGSAEIAARIRSTLRQSCG